MLSFLCQKLENDSIFGVAWSYLIQNITTVSETEPLEVKVLLSHCTSQVHHVTICHDLQVGTANTGYGRMIRLCEEGLFYVQMLHPSCGLAFLGSGLGW